MTKNFLTRAAVFAAGILISAAAFAAGGGNLQQSGVDLNDKASLQRGAALYMNYCGSCPSLKYIRYARIAETIYCARHPRLLQHALPRRRSHRTQTAARSLTTANPRTTRESIECGTLPALSRRNAETL